jgi:hypothetical protein
VGRAPQADPSTEAAVVPGETTGAAAAFTPPYELPRRHQPRLRLLPFYSWGHPSPPMLRWLRCCYPRPVIGGLPP